MPPKSGKKKLSKAEKEKLKKDEAEKKAKEEEEARLAALAEEENKKEKEKEEEEERRRLENEERKRRKGQLIELEQIWESNRSTLGGYHTQRRVDAKWARYMRCDGSPDPTNAPEINTYINLAREEMAGGKGDVDNILVECELNLGLINELEYLLEDTPKEEMTDDQVASYKQTVTKLQNLLSDKLDLASHDLLLKASRLADPETMNLQREIGNSQVTICMWGNLSKNPRIKSFEFEKKGLTFEMPKLLTLSDCAVRLLSSKYDHLSSSCKSFYPRMKKKMEEEPPVEEEEKKEEGEGEEGEKKEGEEGEEKPPQLEQESTEDLMALLHNDGKEPEQQEEEKEAEEEAPMEEDYEIKTPEPAEFEDFDGDEDAVDLRAYHVLGGVMHFNLLHLPPQPKQVTEWLITQVVESHLEHWPYLADTTAPVAATPSSKAGEGSESKREEKPPILVTLRLPEDVYFCEEPQVVRWSKDERCWRLDGFSDHSYNEENRVLTFKTTSFGSMALIQDSHINMPFQSWEIRPRKTNAAVLTIIAAIVEVEIDIREGECCLIVPEDRAELKHLAEKWMVPADFIKALRAAGVNVFPEPDSTKYVSIQNKNAVTEERLYQQMALTASSMAYSWSKWNAEIQQEERIVIQGAEQLQDEPMLEEDWSLFLITKKRTTKLKMTEFDETFSDDHAEGTEFHADLYHMFMDIASEDAKDRIRETSYQFVDTVYQLLTATRLVTYS